MKFSNKTIPCLLALVVGLEVFAQSNGVPGPSDYDSFSRFIANRNIFDPNRVPHSTYVRRPRTHISSASAPFLSLVGIMSYSKGTFAFFNANDPDLRQVLSLSGKIDGYTVTELTESHAKLVSDDKKQTLDLKVGDVLRQENGKWVLSDNEDVPAETSTSPAAVSSSDNSAPADTTVAPSSADQPNEILKRLMELREKENQ